MNATRARQTIRTGAASILVASILTISATAPGAPGTLAQAPLFLATGVKPNVFFVLDDSGSMAFDVVKSLEATTLHPKTLFTIGSVTFFIYDDATSTVAAPTRPDQVIAYCPGYNVLAYDPGITYTPWKGTDNTGVNSYTTRNLTTALDNPFDPNSTVPGGIGNLFYFEWNDDGDGAYEIGECPQPDPAGMTNGDLDASDCATAGCIVASSLTPAEQKNFANWYSYYRTRDKVLKRVASEIIQDMGLRVGLATIHNNDDGDGTTDLPATPVRDLGDTTTSSVCGSTKTHKECLLERLFSVTSSGGTPLRRALDEAGMYFDDRDGKRHEHLGALEDSPILDPSEGGNCQQNFAIVISDGFWNGTWPELFDDSGNPVPDSANQTLQSWGNEDNGGTVTPTTWEGGAQADAYIDTLADIAMHYYETDLSANPDEVNPIPNVDDNTQQHLVTFTVAFGVEGTLTSPPPDRTTTFPWPEPQLGQLTTVDDMFHAAWNSRGEFLSTRSPAAVARALQGTIANIASRQRSTVSSLGFNTKSLRRGTLIFQAQANTADWSGDLIAFDVHPATDAVGNEVWVAPGSAVATGAADVLDATLPANRFILTLGSSGDGVPFETAGWGNLTTGQQDDLRTNGIGSQETDAAGQARLEYLRGERDCEATCTVDLDGTAPLDPLTLRTRGSVLGDIVGSGPLVVGPPALGWPSAGTTLFPTTSPDTYAEFKAGPARNRTPIVYVGANDGMLHGFEAIDDPAGGTELIAYLPASLSSSGIAQGLHFLTDPGYVHRYYVDRTPAISDVYIDTTAGGNQDWHTVAVGGLGPGGRGLYALDITDPTKFSTTGTNPEDIVLWEFSDAVDPELGYSMSQPVIVPTNATDGSGLARWATIVGSGYNDTGTNLNAHLFVFFLDGGIDGIWTENTDYVKLEATIAAPPERNGLSSPAVADVDGDGTADRVYAGDLFGNMWAFDVSDSDPSNWAVASGEDTSGTAATGPLFTAEVTTGGVTKRQPITAKPVISKHPSQLDNGANQPNVMVYFGTGQYLTSADVGNRDDQSFYGVWDKGTTSLTRSNLQPQGFVANTNNQVIDDNPVDWTSQYGWYLDLPDPGERVAVDAVLRGDIVFFNSVIPAAATSCEGGGSGALYAVDMENGGRPDEQPFDVNNNGFIDSTDLVSDGATDYVSGRKALSAAVGVLSAPVFMDDQRHVGTSGGTGKLQDTVFELETIDTGRISWQELGRE